MIILSNKKRIYMILAGCLAAILLLSACSDSDTEPEITTETTTTADTIPTVDIQIETTASTTVTEAAESKPEFPVIPGKTPDKVNINASDLADHLDKNISLLSQSSTENVSKTDTVFTYQNLYHILSGQYNCSWSAKITMPSVSNLKYKFIYKDPSASYSINNKDLIDIDPNKNYSIEGLYDRWVLNNEDTSSLYSADKNKQLYYWLMLYSDDWDLPYCMPITIAASTTDAPLPSISNGRLIFDQPVEITTAYDFRYVTDNDIWTDTAWEEAWLENRPGVPIPYNTAFTDKFSDSGAVLPANTEYDEDIASLAENGRVVIYRGYASDNEYTAWKTINCYNIASAIPVSLNNTENIDTKAMTSADTIADFLETVPIEGEIKYADGTVQKTILIYNFYQNGHDGEYALYEPEADDQLNGCTTEVYCMNADNTFSDTNKSVWSFNPKWDIDTCEKAIDAVIARQNAYLPKTGKPIDISVLGLDTDIRNKQSADINVDSLISKTAENSNIDITSISSDLFPGWTPGEPFYMETEYGIIRFHADDTRQLFLALQMYDLRTDLCIPSTLCDTAYDDLLSIAYKTMLQNPWCPYIANINAAGFDDNNNFIVKVSYTADKSSVEKWRPDIYNKAVSIASEINDISNISDEDRYRLINDKLIGISDYDTEAADLCIYSTDILSQPEDIKASWSPYGVLCSQKGIDYSYAQAYKLICDMLDMNCVTVAGNVSGKNHVWNKVNIDDKWYIIDVVNNDHDGSSIFASLPHAYCLTSDRLAASLHENRNKYTFSDRWYSNEYKYNANDDSLDEWLNNGLLVSLENIPKHFEANFTGVHGDIYAVKIDGIDKYSKSDIDETISLFSKTAVMMGCTESEFGDYVCNIASDIFIFAPQELIK